MIHSWKISLRWLLAPRPSATAGVTEFTYTGVNSGINSSNAPNIFGRSYSITADVDVPQGGGDRMIVTMGGRWGGYGLYILKGKPVFDYTCDGPGIAKGGTGVLKVDGKVVDTQKQANSIAFLQVADETFDVGVDTRTGVNDKDYQVPFPFNGTINKLTFHLGPPQLAEADKEKAAKAIAIAKD
jgi:hypothetical protein